jgi:hypothetical protein
MYHAAWLTVLAFLGLPLASALAQGNDGDLEKARAALLAGGEALFKSIPSLQANARAMAAQLRVEEKDVPRAIAEKAMTQFPKAFELSGEQAAALLAGRFEDETNLESVRRAIPVFEKLGVPLPAPCAHLLDSARNGTMANGIQREFAARYIRGLLAMIQEKLEKKP